MRVKETTPSEPPSKVLLIDDDVLVRSPLAAYLRECGFTVYEAVDTDEAMIVLNAADLRVDIVFSKAEVAETLDGFRLKQWVMRSRSGVPVVLFGSPTTAATAAGELCEKGPKMSPDLSRPVFASCSPGVNATRRPPSEWTPSFSAL